MKKMLLKILVFMIYNAISILYCQLVTNLNHPSNIIVRRLAANGEIDLKYFESNNSSLIKNNDLLKYRKDIITKKSTWDISIPIRNNYINEEKNNYGIIHFFKILKNNNLDIPKKHLVQIESDSILLWLNFRERILTQPTLDLKELYFLDEITINSIFKNKVYLSSAFSMYRIIGNQIWDFNDYNGEWTKYFDEINTTFWYKNKTSIFIKGEIANIEISNAPFSWGWSSSNSPLISAKSTPFNRISLNKEYGSINFNYFHGSIMNGPINDIHNKNEKLEKFIAGHRAQFKLLNNLKFSISELVVYGNRAPELAYLNPISFFWAQEHNLGDLDNILLAFDFAYRAHPGLIIYNTLVLDELSWQDIFRDWWGNKYSYQFGMFLSSKNMKMPDFRFEYTATRPWTYTHPDFPYTNRQSSIGAINGPSSISLRMESFYLPSPSIILQFSLEKSFKGIGLGADLFDNYDYRDKAKDYKTKFLLDQHYSTNLIEAKLHYYITNVIKLNTILRSKQLNNPHEIIFDNNEETNKEIILGLDISL